MRVAEIVQRRNYILDLMKTRSHLSGSRHTEEEYDTAKEEPVVIKPQAAASWRAAHFVWQVREALAAHPGYAGTHLVVNGQVGGLGGPVAPVAVR
mgnify:CR=1 FL=1